MFANKIQGFNLIELMLALFVLSILLAWGMPNYFDFKLRQELSNDVNELVYGFTFARSEAINRGQSVTIKPNSGGWQSGWEIFLDPDEDQERTPANGEDSLLVQNALDENIVFASVEGPAGAVTINSIGGLVDESRVFQVYNQNNDEFKKQVAIAISGSVRAYSLED